MQSAAEADGVDQCRLGRRGLARGAVERVDQSPSGDCQPEVLRIECGEFAERQAALRMKDGGRGHRTWANLRGGGAQRIRGSSRPTDIEDGAVLKSAPAPLVETVSAFWVRLPTAHGASTTSVT